MGTPGDWDCFCFVDQCPDLCQASASLIVENVPGMWFGGHLWGAFLLLLLRLRLTCGLSEAIISKRVSFIVWVPTILESHPKGLILVLMIVT